MDSLCSRLFYDFEIMISNQVTILRLRLSNEIGFITHLGVFGIFICFWVNTYSWYTHSVGSAGNSTSDFTSIGNEQATKHTLFFFNIVQIIW